VGYSGADGAAPVHAIVWWFFKKERTLQRLRHGKVIRLYGRIGWRSRRSKTRQVTTKLPKECMRRIPDELAIYKSIIFRTPVKDRALARQKGIAPGGEVFCTAANWLRLDRRVVRLKNWTDGCVAVSNQEIDEIWMGGDDGTAIEIRP